MTGTNKPANLKLVTFGVRVSEDHPTFQLGEHTFETRLITMGEDRGLTKRQAALPEAEKNPDGSKGELTSEQQEATVDSMADMLVDLLGRRVQEPGTKDDITREWVVDNMVSQDFAPLMYFLRNGHQQPTEADLDEVLGTDLGEDPNVDL
ncbi:hypothetical protein [Deinococcus sp. Leaf326]|uniref:hypothetical protein n=1 Tax=Deinococcus sp. Leaf326 TaxID=1736338 RepID=UPI0006FC1499|nr:hypothetical protein [Deinococcus sp. Leaf326]KQR33118.1 hypothetical protein ASF71_16640 [Deinococcus sp. Leaf326]